jgi:hypothetical protein
MGIQKLSTTPHHPQCNSQVEVVSKHFSKYCGDFVANDTLDWEAFILGNAYNTVCTEQQ